MSDSRSSPGKVTGIRGPGMGRGGPGGMFAAMGSKAKDFKGTMRQLASYLRPFSLTIIVVWILALTSTAFTIIGPWIMGMVTDELVTGISRQVSGLGVVDFGRIASILIMLLSLYLVSALCSWIQGFLMTNVSVKVTYTLRDDINNKLHRLPLSYFDSVTHGEVLSRLTNDVDTVNQTLTMSLTQIITSVSSVVGILCIMFSVNWILTIIALCFLSLSIIFITLIVKQSQKFFKAQQKCIGNVNGHIEEMFSSHIVVKAFCGEVDSVKTFDSLNRELYKSAWKANFLSGLMMPITAFVGNLTYVVICAAGGFFVLRGMITIGGIQAFLQYIRSFNHPLANIANISNILQQTAAAAERVFEFLAETEEIPDPVAALPPPSSRSLIVFDHVRFGYDPAKTVIGDFSACIEPGQKIAIVGPTGAGKTTIVKLLMRFYDVTGGSISIGGDDIRAFKRQDLRSLFGMVLQDTWLFSGTIADNIRYSRTEASDAKTEEAAKAAQVDHFVRTLPGGYGMVLNEESDNISAGQKQLLTIARVILANPAMLILDEATSSVDTRTERLIQKAMDLLMKGRTSFIIAHRLSTIRNADLILVLKDGEIVEQGKHGELLERRGFYAELYNSQFAGREI
ncbi:MAG: ABC transporter ATP-binding protein/permease [Treponema sp.]|jgi:ATP-binding cassette subfamily B protein|nr:ABC transporter ATP-binding protein/permease [Treponema sp.]